jgi:hypothetical protein
MGSHRNPAVKEIGSITDRKVAGEPIGKFGEGERSNRKNKNGEDFLHRNSVIKILPKLDRLWEAF